MRKLLSRKGLFIFLLAVFFVAGIIPSKFAVNLTPSALKRVFYLDKSPDPEQIKKNGYVLFELHTKYIEGAKTNKVIKEVVCVEGETLRVEGKDYYCNEDEYLGRAKDFSLKGERLDNFVFNGVIPKGYTFVSGGHKDSYDSRYWGLLKKEDVKAIAYPVF